MVRVEALLGEGVDFCAVVVLALLNQPVRDQPLEVLDEPRIVEADPHLQVRLPHRLPVGVQGVQEAGEDIEVGSLQADQMLWRSSLFESSYLFSSLSYSR